MKTSHWLLLVCLSSTLGCAPSSAPALATRMAKVAKLETPQDHALQTLLRQTLQSFRDGRKLDTQVNAAWQIMHAVICYGEELQVDTPDRGKVGAVEYLFNEGLVRGFQLEPGDPQLRSTGRQGLRARLEPGSYVGQGHVDQWIAICAMANLPMDTKISVQGQTFTIEDWVRQAQADIPNNVLNEFSWTIIALTHYLPDEPTWISHALQPDGQVESYELSWDTLVAEEMSYDLQEAACGGTHRLAAIVRALKAKEQLRLADSDTWVAAREMIDELIEKAKQHRAGNGRLSAHYFTRPGTTTDLNSQLAGGGHTFEFLALALPQESLKEDWVAQAAERLCLDLQAMEASQLECGALYHALNGLNIYLQRRWPE